MDGIPSGLEDLAVPIDSVVRCGRNPRRGDVRVIAESLERNGQYRPIVVRRDTREVLAGNHTLEAARSLGWDRIAVTFVDCDDEQAARIVLVDNRANDLAGYDDSLLIELLISLPDLDGIGYSQADLDGLLASVPKVRRTNPDEIPGPPRTSSSTVGQVYQLGRHRLMCGDSTNAEHVATLMNGRRARLMATDPPYLVDYDGSNHPQSRVNSAMTKDKRWDEYIDGAGQALYDEFIAVAFEVAVEDNTAVYQWHADMRRHLVIAAWEANGVHPHQTVVWVKPRPVLTRSDFMWQHEPCILGWRHEPALYGWRKGSRPPVERRPPANATTIWELDQKNRNDMHPTEKPVELFARPMRWHLRAGEIAYEPFSGSGSQIIAAEMEARTCYAMELEPQYVDVAITRWQDFTGEKAQPVK